MSSFAPLPNPTDKTWRQLRQHHRKKNTDPYWWCSPTQKGSVSMSDGSAGSLAWRLFQVWTVPPLLADRSEGPPDNGKGSQGGAIASPELSVGARGLWLGLLLVSFNAAIQHLGISRPTFLLRDGWFSRMWIASSTSSSLAVNHEDFLPLEWIMVCPCMLCQFQFVECFSDMRPCHSGL